jgi:DNA-binding transcriptional LysR family regulator
MTDLRRLRYFLAVAEERNFTRAAERLHVAQPALSRQVRTLERELGVELLRRTTHDVELTEAGRELASRGAAVVAAADELWARARSFGAGEVGRVVVGYGTSVGYETAPRLLAEVGERLPGLEVVTRVLPLAAIVDGVREGSVDAGIVRCPPAVAGLRVQVVRREPQGVLMQRDHALASREAVALAALASEPVLLHPRDANAGHYDVVVSLLNAAGVEPEIVLRDVAFDAAQAPVASGRAIAIVGAPAGAAAPPELTWRPLDPPATIDIAVLTRDDATAAATRFAAAATEAAATLGWT